MSVLEYLRFAADLRHLDDATFKKRAKSVVEVCGLAQVLGKEIRHLSHGYRQRVGLAQALIHDPPILILDEPTSDLDPNEKAEFLDYLKQIGKERTVLLSTHNLAEVEAPCARAIIVSRGRIVADGPLDEIRAKSGTVRYVVSIQESAGDRPYRGTARSPKKGEVEDALGKVDGRQEGRPSCRPTSAPTPTSSSSEQDVDLRPELFQLIVDKGWVLLELHRDAQTLEDVFRSLTIGDERRNRTPGAPRTTRRTTTRRRRRGRGRRGRRRGRRRAEDRRRATTEGRQGRAELSPCRNILTIARRELRSQFDSLVAYVVLGGTHAAARRALLLPACQGRRLLAGRPRDARPHVRRSLPLARSSVLVIPA